ncbi:leucine-rich repeat domain-containing protein [Weeksellaceae bacterium KMM 9724]|uniref:leucine-rich repeat domain-containing protein n=1 Tax=Profundicola chukchiensis TaxID=2961959 RepID=UPI0024383DC9|nr:leucine-rich repeat domain-containing protein [Profundicola chukchiensis]MDG4951143.1 leucine-rich repeat domain-containing protein [Profundicola chukchiensis]
MKRILSTPLKICGFLTILLGIAVAILTLGYLIILALYFIGIGLLLYLIDFVLKRNISNKQIFKISQTSLTIVYLLFSAWTYLKWQEHNEITFPKEFSGEAGIIFGIENYPQLPETEFWTKKITIPKNGILITSTKIEEIPNRLQFYIGNEKIRDFKQVDWNPNFEFDCIVSDAKIKAWLFTINGSKQKGAREKITELCNEIGGNKISSSYKSDNSVISTDKKGKYLWLQNKDLTSLPNGLEKLDIYKAILTGNDLTEIPSQVLEISSLQNLIVAGNPIKEFPCKLNKLEKLKSISIAETKISEINCDLSKLDSLEHFDISKNNLNSLPDEIKNVPNLKWLSLNDNSFTNLSFIDKRLENLETLYLYTNKVSELGTETKYLTNLKELLIFDNQIESIPKNIGDLINLQKLEIWNNPIKSISPNISKLTNLRTLRIDDDYLTEKDKENLKSWLPNCGIKYQTRSEK